MTRQVRSVMVVAVLVVLGLGLAACGGDEAGDGAPGGPDSAGSAGTVRLLTHDSFDLSPDVLTAFEATTGYSVEIIAGGDAVSVVNQAILSAGNPVADVLFGVDNNTLAAAAEAGLFEPYASGELEQLDPDLVASVDGLVTPVSVGDVCVNYDRDWFGASDLEPPGSLLDLADPSYQGLLVVQNPATSTPGLAFVAATVAAFGESGWEAYWEQLVVNDVEVADGWEQAYYGEFSGGSGEGDRPLVVSYATSPVAEVFFSDGFAAGELPDEAPTGVVAGTCYRQVEYAGVLAGTDQPEAAQALIDFMVSPLVQEDIPLTMFVEPVRMGVALPEVFVAFSEPTGTVWGLSPTQVEQGRDGWVASWRRIVLG
jgi:thiamine transport system substrate-binding protein